MNDNPNCGIYFCGICGKLLSFDEELFCSECEEKINDGSMLEPVDEFEFFGYED